MIGMSEPRLNIPYWSTLYNVYTNYATEYNDAFEEDSLVDRAKYLWEWKGLNRTIEFDSISAELEAIDQRNYTEKDPGEAIESVSADLQDAGVVDSKSLVTSAFILHLMDSEADGYSQKFPIYDRRVWNAYVYLWRIRGAGETLYADASTSAARYGEFCNDFQSTCPPDFSPLDYERALFMFGGFIMSVSPKDSPTPIDNIDEKLNDLENSIADQNPTLISGEGT